MLPQDPIMLLSVVNTKLRDEYSSLDALCEGENVEGEALCAKLAPFGYFYDKERNQFA